VLRGSDILRPLILDRWLRFIDVDVRDNIRGSYLGIL
jgi:hypothetical protein